MIHETDALDKTLPAGGQSFRPSNSLFLEGILGDNAINFTMQALRYAEDLQQMIERYENVKNHYEEMLGSCTVLAEGLDEMNELVRSLRDMYIITDIVGTIIEFNPASEVLIPPHLMMHTKLQDLVLPSDREKFIALQSKAIENSVSPVQASEMSLYRKNCDAPPLFVSAQVLVVRKEGKVRFLKWVMRDITPQRENKIECSVTLT